MFAPKCLLLQEKTESEENCPVKLVISLLNSLPHRGEGNGVPSSHAGNVKDMVLQTTEGVYLETTLLLSII